MKKIIPLFVCLMSLMGCSGITYNATGYKPLEGSNVSFDGINSLSVDWINGNVIIEQGDDSNALVNESESEYPLYYKVNNQKLFIEVAKSGTSSTIINKLNKDLHIVVPSFLNYLYVSAVNASLYLKGDVTIEKGTFKTVNGNIKMDHYKADESSFDGVNNSIDIANIDYATKEQKDICAIEEGTSECIQPEPVALEHTVDMDLVNCIVNMGISSKTGYECYSSSINSFVTSDFGNQATYEPDLIRLYLDLVNSTVNIKKVD